MKNYFSILLVLIPIYHIAQTDKNTLKRIFFNDSIIAVERWYGDDNKIDSLKTYYKTGSLNEQFYFSNGRYHGKSFKFNPFGEKLTTWEFNQGKLINRTDHKIEFSKKTEEKVKNAHKRLRACNAILAEHPNNLKSTFMRARERVYLDNQTLALNDFKKIEKTILKISKTKKVPEKIVGSVYDNLASIYNVYEMENHTIHYRLKALKASPKESRLYYNLGNYLVQIKSYRLGIEYLNKAIQMIPDHSFANWALAKAYTNLGDYEKALSCINISFKNEATLYKRGRGNSELDIRTIRGYLYHKLGESHKGILDLEEALNINANNSYALKNLGIIYHDLGIYNKSCELLTKAKTLGYEKTHDTYDLDDYLNYSCHNKVTQTNITKPSELPFAYPNSAINEISISHFNFKNFNYRIFNFESKLMQAGKAENNSINISALPSGLYILKIEANKTIHTFKIVKY